MISGKGHNRHQASGFSLMELLFGLVIMLILVSIAVPSYQSFVESSRQSTAMSDIRRIELAASKFAIDSNDFPDSLADIGESGSLDPWGRAYVYLPLRTPADRGKARKDRNLVPLNTDFDLYSVGKDGLSKATLAPPQSHDDIIRANNGRFIGLASDY